tara:strand:- start:70 stop:450 length:381 start_codon:yes stop_codon:yes gene_type:complete
MLCNVGFTLEDLSKIDINKFKELKSYEIKTALSNKKIVGYSYDEDYFEETHMSNGDYLGYSISEGEITGKWKVEDNKLCYKWQKTKTRKEETEFQCTVNIYSNNKKTFYFFDILNKVFYAKGYRVQ